jgi:hypothetical protein
MNFIAAFLLLTSLSFAATKVENVEFADTAKVGSEMLQLNGAGLRKVRRFGFSFKVYVGGLYLIKKSHDENAILKSKDTKYLKMVFVRRVDRKSLVDAWREAFFKACEANCEESKKGLQAFNDLMVDVVDGSTIEITFKPEEVEVHVKGRKQTSATIANVPFAHDLLAIFIGKNPPTENFKAELLGKKGGV